MPKSASAPKSFEAAVSELETIVQQMESGTLTLEDALDRYQRGASLLKYCQETLSNAEQRVRVLEGDSLVDFNPAPTRSDT
ncbi:MAG: exodeoxyribonuclease VII small subunit [Betaproteobacteria bacterium HGW-Betaproteobacteria-13]|jgi:exodeoxyribonuclease VII small subunit|uniref:Exodeoxyribonuclease 7 small subunit n=1 Tax=Parazoarcus communis TaxID=41977 RepID=A0A2U8H774_9RHOO|nr:exodeoxyribonuclease VII small subunit [Parazoarcus communis]AWI81528.1 exodeoxyribonuclease VII small subunit [Parazoarcus communis]PKO58538.1 MAG: exodeoxyribonuclease VII small subunit [Betaproteobacteria bacterium HGW-Betaproteobacteria-19]PKO81824.1 MAG: exodeoxyribonuclease VII small subunit [Betaproteobacteria bacterium HGW-Betaproteobacteria-13]